MIDYFKHIEKIVSLAIEEDIGSGDITAELVPKIKHARGAVICRENAIVCGQPWVDEVFRQIDSSVSTRWHKKEGEITKPGDVVFEMSGAARSILTAERVALNFLQTLMATATTANNFKLANLTNNVRILDSRKTIPGLRLAQKYAVTIGGCENHRIGLFDAFLIKENHIAACGSIKAAVNRARELSPDKYIILEVENIQELEIALETEVDRIMLDNFSPQMLIEAARLKTHDIEYEVSGNVTKSQIESIAQLNIDCISSGTLTKHIHACDLSLQLDTDKI